MPTKRIPFTEWLPDQPSNTGALLTANNVVPVAIGYVPFPESAYLSNAASENLNNVFAAKYDTVNKLFTGGATKLFSFNSATLNLDDISQSGGYTGLNRWNFTQFGSVVLATNNTQLIQAYDINSSSLFADVSATAPTAKYITVVRDFVVAAYIGDQSDKVQWSDINDETNWTPGGASQSDYQYIPSGGNITGITGGEFGLVFLERAVVRMSYIGSPLFFQFDTISRNLGCNTPGSITQYGNITYFLGDDGFYMCDGTNITPIGNDKVDRWFYDNMNVSQQDTISSAIDPIRNIAVWNYPNTDGGRTLLIYNWQLQKWSTADTTLEYISSLATTSTTLEGLDVYGSIEAVPASLDDRLWAGGKLLFGGVDGAKISTYTGNSSTANLIAGEYEFGYNSVLTLARPSVENGSASVSVASRKELDDNINYTTPVAASSEGRCSLRSYGRYHRIKVIPSGSWTYATMVDLDYTEQGNR